MVMFMNTMQKAYLVFVLVLGIPKACIRVTMVMISILYEFLIL